MHAQILNENKKTSYRSKSTSTPNHQTNFDPSALTVEGKEVWGRRVAVEPQRCVSVPTVVFVLIGGYNGCQGQRNPRKYTNHTRSVPSRGNQQRQRVLPFLLTSHRIIWARSSSPPILPIYLPHQFVVVTQLQPQL
jgi:hypothetical protein